MGHLGSMTSTLVPPLDLLWSAKPPTVSSTTAPRPLVVEKGRVFVSYGASFTAVPTLFALDASDGTTKWSAGFGSVAYVGHPAVFAGRVYLANGNSSNTKVWALDAATGTGLWTAPMGGQWEQYWAPIVVDGVLYTNGGYSGGLYGYDAASGAQSFFTALEQYDEWSPAYGAGRVLTFVGGKVRAHDPLSGAEKWQVAVGAVGDQTAPVTDGTRVYVVAGSLFAIDIATQKLAWSAPGSYVAMPAVADGTVYGVSGGSLLARDAATGALQWSVAADGALKYPPVVTNGYVYVASDASIFAFSTSTHAQKWKSSGPGGSLALGAGRLFVSTASGAVSAYLFAP